MGHDDSKVVMAAALSNHKDITNFDVDPAGFPAGVFVSLASTGLPSLLKSAGMRYGVSRGKSLCDTKQTAIQQAGLRVPVMVTGDLEDATWVIPGEKVYINDTTGLADDPEAEGVTISDALYVSGPKTGIQEDATEVTAALVDMQGGL